MYCLSSARPTELVIEKRLLMKRLYTRMIGYFIFFISLLIRYFSCEGTLSKKFFSFNNLDGKLGDPNVSLGKWGKPTTRVKFMHRGLEKGCSAEGFLRQFPGRAQDRTDRCAQPFR